MYYSFHGFHDYQGLVWYFRRWLLATIRMLFQQMPAAIGALLQEKLFWLWECGAKHSQVFRLDFLFNKWVHVWFLSCIHPKKTCMCTYYMYYCTFKQDNINFIAQVHDTVHAHCKSWAARFAIEKITKVNTLTGTKLNKLTILYSTIKKGKIKNRCRLTF